MSNMSISQQHFPTQVRAEFGSEHLARLAVVSLTRRAGFEASQVQLIAPPDPRLAKKLAPENRALGGMIVASQLLLGIAWLVLGLIVAWLLVHFGPSVTRASPVTTYLALMLLAPTIGLLLAGIVSLRADHEQLVRRGPALGSAQWKVAVRCMDREQRARAQLTLDLAAQVL